MARRAKRVKPPKQLKLDVIPREGQEGRELDDLEKTAYAMLDQIAAAHHPHLAEARIVAAWMRDVKSDADGRLHLGQARKAADPHRQMHNCDWIICLNRQAFQEFNEAQRRALIDHELCHAAAAYKKNGDKKFDAAGRQCYRVRKHDVEEFREIIQRHGCWKSDLEAFFQAALERRKEPLLEKKAE